MAVCQHGVRFGGDDVYLADIQQTVLQGNRERVDRCDNKLPNFRHDDRFRVGILHPDVLIVG